ncbi:MAG: hypothetical protein U1E33_05825 [Rhodospirillales bacterium]
MPAHASQSRSLAWRGQVLALASKAATIEIQMAPAQRRPATSKLRTTLRQEEAPHLQSAVFRRVLLMGGILMESFLPAVMTRRATISKPVALTRASHNWGVIAMVCEVIKTPIWGNE